MKKNIFLFSSLLVTLLAAPPKEIPESLYCEYTLQGAVPVLPFYLDDSSQKVGTRKYTKKDVNYYLANIKKNKTFYYGITDTWLYNLLERHSEILKGKDVAIIGSNIPLYESIVLAYGGTPYTIEYNFIEMEDSRLKYISVEEIKNNPIKFDVILSISSFEHDGLGRYGDPLNPKGDLESMLFYKNCLKEGGLMILSVPIGKDALCWNAHRIYGKLRFPMLTKEYEIIDSEPYKNAIDALFEGKPRGFDPYYFMQPVFLLKPKP